MPTMPETVPLSNRNPRPRDEIIADLHCVQRQEVQNVFAEGELLIELKDEIGDRQEFLNRVYDEFGYLEDTAANKMKVAETGFRFPILRTLQLDMSTLYDLARYPEEQQPAVIAEFVRRGAANNPVRHCDAWEVMTVGVGRHRYGDLGDLPDATLFALADLDYRLRDEGGDDAPPVYRTANRAAHATIREQRPTTVDEADEIIDNAIDEAQEPCRRGNRRSNRRARNEPTSTSPEPQPDSDGAGGDAGAGGEAGAGAEPTTPPGLRLAVLAILELPPAQRPALSELTILTDMVSQLLEMRRNPGALTAPLGLVSADQRRGAAAAINDAGQFLISLAAEISNE